ncbi:MAG: phosphate butyryltransferase [Oscillospiraceae bacterium]|nr:phosphate butyryltransferase [Oscillospiraceae bacterium]
MINNLAQLRTMIASGEKKTCAVACAHDAHTLEAIMTMRNEGLMNCLLVGHTEEIKKIAADHGYEVTDSEIIEAETDADAAQICVDLVREGKAGFILKGLLQTATLLKAVVNKQTGLNTGSVISHFALVELPGYHKIFAVADSGMIPSPDLDTKKSIIRNAVGAMAKLGYEKPLIAALCAAENVSPKIIETVDAAALKEASLAGELGSCYVEGPISFDLTMNPESAKIKKFESPVVGNADMLLVPNLATGNIMVKTMLQFAHAQMAGAIVGAKCPIALISRSATYEEKYYSLLLCALIS